MKETELAAAVCARICHDLANPLGAIVNGADLMREIGPGAAVTELNLVEQSARRAAAVLQLHRLAFGIPRDLDATLAHRRLYERIASVVQAPKVTLKWNVRSDGACGISFARLTVLMVLAGRAMLGPGGELEVCVDSDAFLPVSVVAKGPKVAATDLQRGWLRGELEILPESRQVEFALITGAAASAGARLELIEEANRLTLRALPR